MLFKNGETSSAQQVLTTKERVLLSFTVIFIPLKCVGWFPRLPFLIARGNFCTICTLNLYSYGMNNVNGRGMDRDVVGRARPKYDSVEWVRDYEDVGRAGGREREAAG